MCSINRHKSPSQALNFHSTQERKNCSRNRIRLDVQLHLSSQCNLSEDLGGGIDPHYTKSIYLKMLLELIHLRILNKLQEYQQRHRANLDSHSMNLCLKYICCIQELTNRILHILLRCKSRNIHLPHIWDYISKMYDQAAFHNFYYIHHLIHKIQTFHCNNENL